MSRPTLREVAKAAGVSHMTVSRVVRGTLTVSRATQTKVARAIAQTGYKPDPMLSALAAYRSRGGGGHGNLLAFLDCDGTEYSRRVLAGAQREGGLLGYRVERFSLPRDADRQRRLARTLLHRGARGLLFGPSDEPRQLTGWAWDECAAVSLGALAHTPAMHAVAMDYFAGAAEGCLMLQRAGSRRPALIVSGLLETRTGNRWLGGYCSQLPPTARPLVWRPARLTTAALRQWVARERVDGILTIHAEVRAALAGRVPLTVFLNDNAGVTDAPRYALDPAQIGTEGVRLLHLLLLRREHGLPREPKMVALRGRWEDFSLTVSVSARPRR